VNYEVMGYAYNKGYYFAYGIYLEWPVFVKTCRDPKEKKYKRLAKRIWNYHLVSDDCIF
jgi:hypothetical protein